MKKKLFIGIAAVAVAAIVAININLVLQGNTFLSTTSLQIIETSASAEESTWWDSKTHECNEAICSMTVLFWTYYGKYEQCKDGSSVAHCWDCASCDA
jgi:hypothetical protein